MNFLGVGPMELIFILVIILVVIGPRDVAKTARSMGRFLNRLYRSEAWRSLTQASHSLRTLPNRLAREAAIEELDEVGETLREVSRGVSQEVRSMEEGLDSSVKPSFLPDPEASKKKGPPPTKKAPRPPKD